jgi:hypothetical protein
MAITNFIPEIWSAQLQSSLKKATVFGSPAVCNRNYEGEIRNAGDSVRIVSISRPTVAAYTKNSTTVTAENLTDAERTLLINQANYFAFEIDDVDYRQAANGGELMSEAADEAAYALADTADQYIAGLYTGVDAGNQIGTYQCNTAALAVTGLLNLKGKLDAANVPNQGRYVVVPPWFHNLLLGSTLFTSVADSGNPDGLRNGHVGRAYGFDVFMSNNCVLVTGDDYIVQAGYPGAYTYAEQINSVEAYRPESAFSDALKGLHLFGAKLLRPTGVATLLASVT